MEEVFDMSSKEIDRYCLIKQVIQKQIKQKEAAKILNLSDRQVRNLVYRLKFEGKKGFRSKKRGKPSNRSFDSKFKNSVLALIRERYPDFGPSFAKEKLQEYHQLCISKETLRKWMIESHIWVPKKSKRKIHPSRSRCEHFGELIQIDASIHNWFEDRAERCALIVFIDDATSKLTSLHFCPVECLEGYFIALQKHLTTYGRPRALYSDRHSIFGGSKHIHEAQFIRALKELDIESVLAGSAQAKGRVERVNQTLQDRLIKEMRLRSIDNIEDGNRFLEEYVGIHNEKFSKEPRGLLDAHRPLDAGVDLDRILTRLETRTLTKDLSFSFHSRSYQIVEPYMTNRLRRAKVEVRQKYDGTIKVYRGGKELRHVALEDYVEQRPVLDSKAKLVWNDHKRGHHKGDHPWRKYVPPRGVSRELKQYEAVV